MEQEFKVKSLAKAMNVLDCFSNQKPELGITEIAQMLNLQKSTVHNILSTFEAMGYISQNRENSKYYLGVRLLQFSYIINNHIGLRDFFLPYMDKIAAKVREIVYLGIPHEDKVLYIECRYPDTFTGGSRNILGEQAPMVCTGLGKAMLAFLPEETRETILRRRLECFTENTIMDPDILREDLIHIRERGYSIDNMEHEYGVKCIGFPVFGHDRQLVAAISVSGPSLRFDNETVRKNAEIIRKILEPVQYQM